MGGGGGGAELELASEEKWKRGSRRWCCGWRRE
jgi:hypothetical protein